MFRKQALMSPAWVWIPTSVLTGEIQGKVLPALRLHCLICSVRMVMRPRSLMSCAKVSTGSWEGCKSSVNIGYSLPRRQRTLCFIHGCIPGPPEPRRGLDIQTCSVLMWWGLSLPAGLSPAHSWVCFPTGCRACQGVPCLLWAAEEAASLMPG